MKNNPTLKELPKDDGYFPRPMPISKLIPALTERNVRLSADDGQLVATNAAAQFAASADSSRTGIFSTDRTANTSAVAGAATTPPVTITWGTGSFGVLNEGAANASATAKSGNVSSTN